MCRVTAHHGMLPACIADRVTSFLIDGQWVAAHGADRQVVVNPADGAVVTEIALADPTDIDRAVHAARRAFPAFSAQPVAARVALLERIRAACQRHQSLMAGLVTLEMGAPTALAMDMHTASSLIYLDDACATARSFAFTRQDGGTRLVHEAIGVCALIAPWNWPLNQIITKLAPALGAGCTVVIKPSELSPLSALLLGRIMDEAGVPAGVVNIVNGTGPVAGACLAAHPQVDMVSFTGSTRAGIAVAQAAAPTVKRVHQELGGKSPAIIMPDADLPRAVADVVARCTINSGQSCIASSRMLVPRALEARALELAAAAMGRITVGLPTARGTDIGPVTGVAQFDRVQGYIRTGMHEGARLLAGGPGRPDTLPPALQGGYYCRPTLFGDVRPDMRIAREEIFGPVLSVLAYDTVEDAVALANDTVYGLAGYVYGTDAVQAERIATRIRAGRIFINNPPFDFHAPFGGYRQSGNGRELGTHGLLEFLEVKAMLGCMTEPVP